MPFTDLQLTLAGLVASAGVAAFGYWRHFRPTVHYRRINWMVVCLGAVSVAFVLLVHLANLAGFETGRR